MKNFLLFLFILLQSDLQSVENKELEIIEILPYYYNYNIFQTVDVATKDTFFLISKNAWLDFNKEDSLNYTRLFNGNKIIVNIEEISPPILKIIQQKASDSTIWFGNTLFSINYLNKKQAKIIPKVYLSKNIVDIYLKK